MKYISIKNLFPRLYKFWPGLIKGTYYAVTGNSGTGKTKFAKLLFVKHAYDYCKENKIPLRILYFALEESKEKFRSSLICDRLKELHNISLTYYDLIGAYGELSADVKQKIKAIEPEVDEMLKTVTVIDHVYNPSGIYKTVREFMTTVGKVIKGEKQYDDNGNDFQHFDFVYNDPDTHVIVVVDHVSLISPEKNEFKEHASTKHGAMTAWSEYVVRYLTKKYKIIVCNVHQQEMAGDNVEAFKVAKLEPELNKIADNKIIGRDYEVVFGVFNPARYELDSHNRYNIKALGQKYRGIPIIKHRDGEEGLKLGTHFDGARNYFAELPPADEITLEYMKNIVNR